MGTNELMVQTDTTDVAKVWGSPEMVAVVRKTFAPDATDAEFAMYLGLAKARGANPFMKEIYFIKYRRKNGTYDVSMPFSYHFLVKKAQATPEYEGHFARAVYPCDEYVNRIVTGEDGRMRAILEFTPGPEEKRQGNPTMAFCVVHAKGRPDIVVEIKFSDFNKGRALWLTMPRWMIIKCAIACAMRAAFAGAFEGIYIEEEMLQIAKETKLGNIHIEGQGIAVETPAIEAEVVKEIPAETPKKKVKPKSDPPKAVPFLDPDVVSTRLLSTEIEPQLSVVEMMIKNVDSVRAWMLKVGVPKIGVDSILEKYKIDAAIGMVVNRKDKYDHYVKPPWPWGGE